MQTLQNLINRTPIMYSLPRMLKTPIGAIFVVVSKIGTAKLLVDTISKTFKMIFNTAESFHNKSFFYAATQRFWMKHKFKKAVKLISIKKLNLFQLLTLAPYIQPTHIHCSEELFQKLLTFYQILKSENALALLKRLSFGFLKDLKEDTLLNQLLSMSFLISKCFFTTGNMVFKQDIVQQCL